MLEIKSEVANYSINVPTELKEFTPDVFKNILDSVTLPKHHAVIAICFEQKLSDIALNVNNVKERNINVIPLLAKVNDDEIKEFNLVVGDKVIIERSSLERSTHLTIPLSINASTFSNFIRNDEQLRSRLIKGGDGTIAKPIIHDIKSSKKDKDNHVNLISPKVYVVEFKIIYINDIKATIPITSKINDIFKSSNVVVN